MLDADQIKSGGITNEMVRQWGLLNELKVRKAVGPFPGEQQRLRCVALRSAALCNVVYCCVMLCTVVLECDVCTCDGDVIGAQKAQAMAGFLGLGSVTGVGL